ncbi:MAG: PaaI family thioesterase [Ilumatobacter sp.]
MAALGIRLHTVAPGEIRLRFDSAENLTQHHGFVHAGVIGSVLDSACGWASQTLMPAGTEVLTVEYKLNLLRPAAGGTFEGVVTRPGATITFASGQLVEINDPERPIATMTATLIGARPN